MVVPPEVYKQVAPHVEAFADYEGLPAHAPSVRLRFTPGRGDRHDARPHDDLALMSGYHSPQVDVAVRLNTNEAPAAPPAAFTRRLGEALATIEWHRYPDRGYRTLREAIAKHHGVAPEQVFAANGSNEVLQTILLAYGGNCPGRHAAVFEPTYAYHSHIARITGTEILDGRTLRRPHARPWRGPASGGRACTRDHVPVLTRQPDRNGRARGSSQLRSPTWHPV